MTPQGEPMDYSDAPAIWKLVYTLFVLLVGGWLLLMVAHSLFGTPRPMEVVDLLRWYL